MLVTKALQRHASRALQGQVAASFALKRAAVVLSGSGVYDGSEITEAVSLFVALNKYGVAFECFAPDAPQREVINHARGQPQTPPQQRNVLEESARIARGKVSDIKNLTTAGFDAVFVPGGFGAAKNLSDFAVKGDATFVVQEDVQRVVRDFYAAKKVVAACCIAPLVIAKALPKGVRITLGRAAPAEKWPYGGTIQVLRALGANAQECDVNEVCVDREHRVVTAPAFMYEGTFYDVFKSVDRLVEEAVKLDAQRA